jgi:hypothetical protein
MPQNCKRYRTHTYDTRFGATLRVVRQCSRRAAARLSSRPPENRAGLSSYPIRCYVTPPGVLHGSCGHRLTGVGNKQCQPSPSSVRKTRRVRNKDFSQTERRCFSPNTVGLPCVSLPLPEGKTRLPAAARDMVLFQELPLAITFSCKQPNNESHDKGSCGPNRMV